MAEANQAKPVRLLLVCAMGMSSSLLEAKILEAAKAAGVPMELKAITTADIGRWDFKRNYVDIVLVAPQIRFKKKSITQAASPHGIIVQDIDPVMFGMAEGGLIFQRVMTALQARDAGQPTGS